MDRTLLLRFDDERAEPAHPLMLGAPDVDPCELAARNGNGAELALGTGAKEPETSVVHIEPPTKEITARAPPYDRLAEWSSMLRVWRRRSHFGSSVREV
jgi:hypothetical protein